MPMRTEPALSPGLRTHSCSAVYFRSSGYNAAPLARTGQLDGRCWDETTRPPDAVVAGPTGSTSWIVVRYREVLCSAYCGFTALRSVVTSMSWLCLIETLPSS